MLDTDFVFQDFDWANYSPTDFNPSTFNEYIPAPDPPAYVPPAYAPPAYDPPASAPASVDYYDWAGYSPTDFAPATYNDYTPVQETVAYVPAPLEYDVGPDYNPPEYNPSSYNDYVPAQETVAYVPAQQTATYVPAPLEYTDWSGYNPPEYNPSTYNDYVPAQETATYVPAPLEYNVGPDYNPPEYNPSTNNEHVPVQDTATYVPAPLDMPSVNSIGYQNFGGEDFASNVTAPNNSLATTTNTTTRPWNHEAMFYQTMGYFLNVSTTHPQYAEYFKMYDLLTDRQVEYHPDRDYSRYGPYQAEWEALDFMTYSNSQARSLGVSWDVYQRSVIMAREAFINNLGTSVERYYSDGDYGSGGGFFGGDETVGRRSAFQAGEVSWSVSPALASEMNSGSVVNRGGQLGQWVKAGLPIDFDPNNDQPDLLQKRAWVPLGDGFGGGGATGSWEDLTKPKDRPNGDMPDGLYEIGTPFSPSLEEARLALQVAREELSNSIDNAVLGRAGEKIARAYLTDIRGLTIIGVQARVWVFDADGKRNLRVYDFIAKDASGVTHFIEVKTGGGSRDGRQLELDELFARAGGNWGTSRVDGYTNGGEIGPIVVEEININLPRDPMR